MLIFRRASSTSYIPRIRFRARCRQTHAARATGLGDAMRFARCDDTAHCMQSARAIPSHRATGDSTQATVQSAQAERQYKARRPSFIMVMDIDAAHARKPLSRRTAQRCCRMFELLLLLHGLRQSEQQLHQTSSVSEPAAPSANSTYMPLRRARQLESGNLHQCDCAWRTKFACPGSQTTGSEGCAREEKHSDCFSYCCPHRGNLPDEETCEVAFDVVPSDTALTLHVVPPAPLTSFATNDRISLSGQVVLVLAAGPETERARCKSRMDEWCNNPNNCHLASTLPLSATWGTRLPSVQSVTAPAGGNNDTLEYAWRCSAQPEDEMDGLLVRHCLCHAQLVAQFPTCLTFPNNRSFIPSRVPNVSQNSFQDSMRSHIMVGFNDSKLKPTGKLTAMTRIEGTRKCSDPLSALSAAMMVRLTTSKSLKLSPRQIHFGAAVASVIAKGLELSWSSRWLPASTSTVTTACMSLDLLSGEVQTMLGDAELSGMRLGEFLSFRFVGPNSAFQPSMELLPARVVISSSNVPVIITLSFKAVAPDLKALHVHRQTACSQHVSAVWAVRVGVVKAANLAAHTNPYVAVELLASGGQKNAISHDGMFGLDKKLDCGDANNEIQWEQLAGSLAHLTSLERCETEMMWDASDPYWYHTCIFERNVSCGYLLKVAVYSYNALVADTLLASQLIVIHRPTKERIYLRIGERRHATLLLELNVSVLDHGTAPEAKLTCTSTENKWFIPGMDETWTLQDLPCLIVPLLICTALCLWALSRLKSRRQFQTQKIVTALV